jgi:hypothetical protein
LSKRWRGARPAAFPISAHARFSPFGNAMVFLSASNAFKSICNGGGEAAAGTAGEAISPSAMPRPMARAIKR